MKFLAWYYAVTVACNFVNKELHYLRFLDIFQSFPEAISKRSYENICDEV